MKEKLIPKAIAILSVLILLGCASSKPYNYRDYKPGAGSSSGGYFDRRIKENFYEVSFKGSKKTPKLRAYEYSILRGLEIGKQLGFAYMLIESEKDSSRTKTTTGTVADNKVSVYGTVYGSREKTYKKIIAGATLRVRFFDQKPKGRYLEDKLFPIFSSVVELRHKYGLDN